MIILFLKLCIALCLVFFIPGYFFMKALFGKKSLELSALEKICLIFGLSLASSNLIVIFLNFLQVQLTTSSILVAIILFCLFCLIISRRHPSPQTPKDQKRKGGRSIATLHSWSYRQILIFIVFLLLATLPRLLYIARGIMPKTTDLGHHMYWAKHITTFGQLPIYGMPDFIIGEHIIFATVSLFSGISFVSTMPVIILFLINIFSILSVFILTYHIALHFGKKKEAKKVALLSLLVVGAFYAVSSPQAKFVSGGVIGNIIGNFLIPLSIYSLVLAIKKRGFVFAQLFIIFSATLAFTHHLSTFILLYILVGVFSLSILILTWKNNLNVSKLLKDILFIAKPFLNIWVIITVFSIGMFTFFVYTPSYLNLSAIDTAVGTPIKETRTGLTINNIISNIGAWRAFFGFVGILFLVSFVFIQKRKGKLGTSQLLSFGFLIAWITTIFFMSWKPALLRVDIPSNRIVSYISYPFVIASAIGIFIILANTKKAFSGQLYVILFLVFFGTSFISVFADLSESARDRKEGKTEKTKQTYFAAQYLQKISSKDENVLKDHIHLEGDTWIKLFFMRGYKYPLSRSYLKRYDDIAKKRETCTRDMVAIPDSEIGINCFEKTGVKYVMLERKHDTAQFEKSQNFDKIYTSDHVVIFQRLPQ